MALIERVRSSARENNVPATVLTFDPHPQHVLAPPGTPREQLIISLDKKLALLEEHGIDLTLVITFDRAFSRVTAYDFLSKIIVGHFHPLKIVVGYDHHFGYRRQGDAGFIADHAKTFNYAVERVEAVSSADTTISSSAIREQLSAGHVEAAGVLLGWPYEVSGTVVAGRGRGQRLAFPTANLNPHEKYQLLPKMGVYIVAAELDAATVYGMCNIGVRPTFNEEATTIETHFFNLRSEDLYGTELALRFLGRIRDERRFRSPEELTRQLERDKQASLDWLADRYPHDTVLKGGAGVHAAVN